MVLGCALSCACSFDSGGSSGDAGGRDASSADAGVPDAMGDCPEPRRLRISVNGAAAPLGPAQPYAHVRLGDTVALSAAGSCVQRGPISYEWQISPIDETRDRALPGLDARDLTVYSTVAGRQYTVRLTITDGDGQTTSDLIYAFQVHGFAPIDGLPGAQEVSDLAYGGGALWVASSHGGFRYDRASGAIADLGATWTFNSADVFTNDVEKIWYDTDADLVWIGHKASKAGMWRGAPAIETFDFIRYDGAGALGDSTEVNDIGPARPGVRIATNLGVTSALNDTDTFNGLIAPDGIVVEAIGGDGAADWMGGTLFWPLATPTDQRDPFAVGGDNKIRAIAMDGEARAWLASDGFGVARVDGLSGDTVTVYDATNTGDLQDDQVRALALGPDGDVWAATKSGVARRKRDRQVWVRFGATSGLADRIDLKAIAIDPATGDVYAGSSKGLVYIRLP